MTSSAEAPPEQSEGIDGLTVAAVTYLVVPNLIFLFGWFRLPAATMLCGAMLFFLFKLPGSTPINWQREYSKSALLLILAVGALWSAFGGGSHFMFANSDWVVRDAVLGDLINQTWPVHYLSPQGGTLLLRSAIGYFLPPALFGSIFGMEHLDLAVFTWTTAGVLLFLLLLPLPKRTGWPLLVALLLVVFFSGMDFLGQIISTESLPMFPLRLEWWVALSYPSLSVQLLWAPNHCLPIWVSTLLLLRYWNQRSFLIIAVAALPLTLIWTPFAALGLVPFALLGTFKYFKRFGAQCIPWSAMVAAAAFSLPIALFLLIDVGGIDAGVVNQAAIGGESVRPPPSVSFHHYLLFIACEFLMLALVLAPHVKRQREVFWLAVLVLIVLPMFRIGPSNDLLLRLSTPPLIILLVSCLEVLFRNIRTMFHSSRWLACLFLAIGALSGFNELWRAANYQRWVPDYQYTLADRQGGHPAAHYAGALGSSSLRLILKPLPAAN